MARALLIDLDGVIREWPDGEVDQVPGLDAEIVRSVMFAPELLERAVTGAITDEEWQSETADRLRAAHGVDCGRALLAARAYPGRTRPEVLEVCRRVRRNAPICLVTNATSRLGDHLDQLGLTDEFDRVFNSSEIGIAKPDVRIFNHACNELGLTAADVVFVDDTVVHVQAAAAAGLHAYRFTRVDVLEANLIRESLLP